MPAKRVQAVASIAWYFHLLARRRSDPCWFGKGGIGLAWLVRCGERAPCTGLTRKFTVSLHERGRLMSHEMLAERILTVVRLTPDCTVRQVIQQMEGCRWSDVFFEVHHLSRSGRLQLTPSSADLQSTLRAP